jgi:hypothetical protein
MDELGHEGFTYGCAAVRFKPQLPETLF